MKAVMIMRRLRLLLLYILLLAVFVLLLLSPTDVRKAAAEGLQLCFFSVLPSLFPFFVLTSLLVSLGFCSALGRLLQRPMRVLFGLGGSGAGALALGLLGGYPAGARAVSELYTRGLCEKDEAERLLSFCNNCGPAFLLSYVGIGIFQDLRTGVWLYLIHVLSAVGAGILLRPRKAVSLYTHSPIRSTRFSTAFADAVNSGFSAYLSVCSFVLLFSILLQPVKSLGRPLLLGLVELFSGISALAPTRQGFILAAFFTAWGGLSVHGQALAFILPAGLSPKHYFFGKLLQALLSFALAVLFVPFIL